MDRYTQPDFSSVALITIDTQCDTLDSQPLEIPGTSAALPQMKSLLTAFRQAALPIVHVVRLYKQDGNNVELCRRAAVEEGAQMLIAGTDGCQLAPELLPDTAIRLDTELLLSGGIQHLSDNEVIIYKPRWGAFYETSLEAHLQELEVSTLTFTGCNFPNCPRTSIYEASERDYLVVLVEDAISGLYERGISEMENIGVQVMNTKELVEVLVQQYAQPQFAVAG